MDLNGARRKNATRETTSTLKAWLSDHRKNPYPTKGEKIMLAIITKMTLTQVSTWFANARRRLKKENKMTWSPRNRCDDDDDDDHDDDRNPDGNNTDGDTDDRDDRSDVRSLSGHRSPSGSPRLHHHHHHRGGVKESDEGKSTKNIYDHQIDPLTTENTFSRTLSFTVQSILVRVISLSSPQEMSSHYYSILRLFLPSLITR